MALFLVQPCSKGIAVDDPLKTSPDDVSTIASDIEAELLICYLETGEAWYCYGIIHTGENKYWFYTLLGWKQKLSKAYE